MRRFAGLGINHAILISLRTGTHGDLYVGGGSGHQLFLCLDADEALLIRLWLVGMKERACEHTLSGRDITSLSALSPRTVV